MDHSANHNRSFPRPDSQFHNPFDDAQSEYSFSNPSQTRIDSLSHNGQVTDYPMSAASETRSPFSIDYNLAFGGSPHSSLPGGIDQTMESAVSDGYYIHSTLSDTGSISGVAPLAAQPRVSVASVGGQSHNHRNSSAAGSEPWTPGSSRGLIVPITGDPPSNALNENAASKDAEAEGRVKKKEEEEDADGKPPAWSELRTKAGKERKRLPLACIACRRKKIRCSGEKPACKHCLRSRIPCVYKVTTRKAAPRTDYMAMLDKRLKRMEERVIKIIPKEDLPDLSHTGRANVRPPIPGQPIKGPKSPTMKKRSADEAFLRELEEWTESKAPVNGPDGVNRLKSQKEGDLKLLTEGEEYLPSRQIQEHLVEVFFDCVYGQSYLLLHKPSFMRKMKAGLVPPVLILAICAISARFSTHPEVGGDPPFLRGDSWATPAREIVEKRHFEPNITILTVMLILGLHYFGTCEGGLSWSFGGQAMRMAYALQLHIELDHDPLGRKKTRATELSFTDREIRRRTMWACFLMDRFTSSGTERPSFGNEEYLHIQLPIKESHFQMEIPGPTEDLNGSVPNPISPGSGQISDPLMNMGVAAYVIRAIIIWGRIVKYFNLGGKEKDAYPLWHQNSQFADLRRQVMNFKESLPDFLAYNAENLQNHAAERLANQFLYLHIICHQNTLFLNRFAIPVSPGARPPKDMPKQFLSNAGREGLEAANHISKLIQEAAGHMLTVPFAGYCAYAASTVHVWGIFSKNPHVETASKENLRHNYKYLNKMKKYWGMFHFLTESVKTIYRHFAEAAIKGPSTTDTDTQGASMFQYGDWFDKSPHGVSQADWDESDPEIKAEPGTEAVMSQQSDLQSVEEFFASLSPPSKAEQSRKMPRRLGKGGSDSRKTSEVKLEPRHTLSQQFQRQAPASLQSIADATPFDMASQASQFSNPLHMYSQHVLNQPPSFNISTSTNFYPAPGSQQIDRQMVLGAAYAGMEPTRNIFPASNGMFDVNTNINPWDSFDFNAMSANPYTGESSTAWFMPFNMEPPPMSDLDSNLLMGDFSMPNSFSGPSGPIQNQVPDDSVMGPGML